MPLVTKKPLLKGKASQLYIYKHILFSTAITQNPTVFVITF